MDFGNPASILMPNSCNGLKVLLIDPDTISLMHIASELEKQFCRVTRTALASIGLSLIGERNAKYYDVVISEFGTSEIGGFDFLRNARGKTTIPIIMMSANKDFGLANKAIAQGASFFLEKPIIIQNLVNVLQQVLLEKTRISKDNYMYVTDKKTNELLTIQNFVNTHSSIPNLGTFESSVLDTDTEINNKEDPSNGIHAIEVKNNGLEKTIQEHQKSGKRTTYDISNSVGLVMPDSPSYRNQNESIRKDIPGTSSGKRKSRLRWSKELHNKFLKAIDVLGIERASPRTILNLMGTPYLTVQQIGSHLQKYRESLKNAEKGLVGKKSDFKHTYMYGSVVKYPPILAKKPQLNTEESSYYSMQTPAKHFQQINYSSGASATELHNIVINHYHNLGIQNQGNQVDLGVSNSVTGLDKLIGNKWCSTDANQLTIKRQSSTTITNVYLQSDPCGINAFFPEERETENLIGIKRSGAQLDQLSLINDASSIIPNNNQKSATQLIPTNESSNTVANFYQQSDSWVNDAFADEELQKDLHETLEVYMQQLNYSEENQTSLQSFNSGIFDVSGTITEPIAQSSTFFEQGQPSDYHTSNPFGNNDSLNFFLERFDFSQGIEDEFVPNIIL